MNRIHNTLLVLVFAMILAGPGPAGADAGQPAAKLLRVLADRDVKVANGDGTFGVWVKFSDRDLAPAELAAALQLAEEQLTPRAATRRAKTLAVGERVVDESDLPVAPSYLAAVVATGAVPRRESRWLNAASFDVTREQIETIARLPFVTGVELIARYEHPPVEPSAAEVAQVAEAKRRSADKSYPWSLDYGGGRDALEMINVPPVHDMDLTGAGVVIGVIDTGFEMFHEALQHLDVVATWDFINDNYYVGDAGSDPENQGMHGTEALSLIAGFSEGNMVGTAYNASFILAKTEEIDREVRLEEDNWIAALEWIESLGADIVSSAIGYVDWYQYSDLDGLTAPITVAADMAASRGVCVINAAGNQRGLVGQLPMMAPADGRKVISVGSVQLNGIVSSFSSQGPTYDGRIKPDICAMGSGAVVASWWADWIYTEQYGSSYASSQITGVVALMLERMPSLTPLQVREALRMTADHAQWPDNDYGWGLVDALAAVNYWAPVFEHEPRSDHDDLLNPIAVDARITSRFGLDAPSLILNWRTNFQEWHRVQFEPLGDDMYRAEIPVQPAQSYVQYYLEASDGLGLTLTEPLAGADAPHYFLVRPDLTPPQLTHHYLPNQHLDAWPPIVKARATDNIGIDRIEIVFAVAGGSEQGPFPLERDGDGFELNFPLDVGALSSGDRITYSLTAWDASGAELSTVSGPHSFVVANSLGRVLVVEDQFGIKSDKASPARGPEMTRTADGQKTSATEIYGWLVEAGYEVDLVETNDIQEGMFNGYNAVVVSSATSFYPFASEILRGTAVHYVEQGGRLMVEGGETGYAAMVGPGYPELAETVLNISDVVSEGGYTMHTTYGMADRPFLHRPHELPSTLQITLEPGYATYGASDVVIPDDDAEVMFSTSFGARTGGVVIADQNTSVDGGQVVFLPFNIGFLKPEVARQVVENALAHLLIVEPAGRSAISGQILLAGSNDHAGVTVSTDTLHTAVTDSDGFFTIAGLWGADYVVTARAEGYAPRNVAVPLIDDQQLMIDPITLQPVTVVEHDVTGPLPIPDNSPSGIDSEIEVTTVGTVQAIEVRCDISHYSIGHLTVSLTSPGGTVVVLHNRTGGTTDDLIGTWPGILNVDGPGTLDDFLDEEATGVWTLNVADHQFGAVGTVNSWGLTLQLATGDPTTSGVAEARLTRLLGNAPNPFNPQTVIAFDLAEPGPVQLEIFDLRGLLVRRLLGQALAVGRHEVIWNGRDEAGQAVASGTYFYRITTGAGSQVAKMALVR